MLKRFLTNNDYYPVDDERSRKTFLLNCSLLLITFILLSFSFLNVTLFQMPEVALLELVSALIIIAIFIYFHCTHHLMVTSVVTIILGTIITLVYIHLLGPQFYAFFWLIITPAATFFLLGIWPGYLFSLFFFAYFGVYMVQGVGQWQPSPFTFESISNIGAASLVLFVLIAYGEISRKAMYDLLKERTLQLEHLSSTDSLTGLWNRHKLEVFLDIALKQTPVTVRISHAEQALPEPSLVLIDIDLFKQINDRYGHLAGDLILVEVAGLLRQVLEVDHVQFGRWGGDEFLVISQLGRQGTLELAEKLRRTVEQHTFSAGHRQTISAGISHYQTGDGPDCLLKRADIALYQNKAAGRNRAVVMPKVKEPA